MPNKHQVPGAFWNVAQPKAFTNDFPMNLKLWLPHFNDNNKNNYKNNYKNNINHICYLGCSYKTQTWNISPFLEEDTKKHHFSFNNAFPFHEKGQLSQTVWIPGTRPPGPSSYHPPRTPAVRCPADVQKQWRSHLGVSSWFGDECVKM